MARPNWEYIRVDVLLPDHPKLDTLSAAAKWTLVELWCYCARNRTDGMVSHARWKTFATPAVRTQIIAAGLVDAHVDGWVMHDYLEHQRSRGDIDELAAKRAEAGRRGAAKRWQEP